MATCPLLRDYSWRMKVCRILKMVSHKYSPAGSIQHRIWIFFLSSLLNLMIEIIDFVAHQNVHFCIHYKEAGKDLIFPLKTLESREGYQRLCQHWRCHIHSCFLHFEQGWPTSQIKQIFWFGSFFYQKTDNWKSRLGKRCTIAQLNLPEWHSGLM